MTTSGAEQLTLAGLAPRKRRKRAPAEHTPAEQHPIAQVVLDVQALHLGQTFDYFIDEKDSEAAQPGVLVRVRFGSQRVSGVIWARTDTSDTPRSSIRYIERVLSPDVLVPASMREDIGLVAKAYGGTRANILRFAVPPRVPRWRPSSGWPRRSVGRSAAHCRIIRKAVLPGVAPIPMGPNLLALPLPLLAPFRRELRRGIVV